MNSDSLQVVVMTPVKVLYDGQALSVSSLNNNGPFDILPEHAKFISLIQQKVVLQINEQKKKSFEMDRGVLHCDENKVKVYIGL